MIGVIVGLAAEARIARRLGGAVEIGGGDAAGAGAAAERLVSRGATGLVSFGLAGGLDPGLRPGSLVIPARVITDARDYAADPALSRRLGGNPSGALLGASAVIADAAAKRAARHRTGAAAVDLESGKVAETARRHGLAFAVLRAICDPADFDLPPAALLALDAGGAITLWPLLRSLAGRPGQLPALLRLAAAAAASRRTLLARVDQLAGSFQDPTHAI